MITLAINNSSGKIIAEFDGPASPHKNSVLPGVSLVEYHGDIEARAVARDGESWVVVEDQERSSSMERDRRIISAETDRADGLRSGYIVSPRGAKISLVGPDRVAMDSLAMISLHITPDCHYLGGGRYLEKDEIPVTLVIYYEAINNIDLETIGRINWPGKK